MMNPHSRLGIRLLHVGLRAASHPGLRNFAAKAFARPPVEPDLSPYRAMETGRRPEYLSS